MQKSNVIDLHNHQDLRLLQESQQRAYKALSCLGETRRNFNSVHANCTLQLIYMLMEASGTQYQFVVKKRSL